MFGSNPFVSSFAPQQGWGQNNAWSSGGSQNWGGSQPWSTSNGSVNSSQSQYNPYGSGYGYQTPTTDTYGQNGGGGSGYQMPHTDTYGQQPYGQPQQPNPYYSQNPYGMPQNWGQGSYGPNGWIPSGSMPPWMNGSNPPMQPPQNNGNTVGRNGGLTGPYTNQTQQQTASTFPTEPSPDNSTANTFNPTTSQQPPPWSTTMMPNWANTNNPNAYMPGPNHPVFVPDIIARMMYADRGYQGNNGMYVNPDGSLTF